jgi:hypothetical protein
VVSSEGEKDTPSQVLTHVDDNWKTKWQVIGARKYSYGCHVQQCPWPSSMN